MRLLVNITAHGWGHLSQTALIIDGLKQRVPGLDLIVRSGIEPAVLTNRLGTDIHCISSDDDFGLVMETPFAVDQTATFGRYQEIHDEFDRHVDSIVALIETHDCHAVLSNVSYLAIVAARRVGVPAFAYSSLNWGDIFATYCGSMPGADAIHVRIQQSYREADRFFRLAPSMPMSWLQTVAVPSPVSRVGHNRSVELRRHLGVDTLTPLVLCAFAGLTPDHPPRFVREPGKLLIIGPSAWTSLAPTLVRADDVPLSFADLIASVDLVVSKPGYGIVAELACAGTPAVLVSRNDWPEEPYLLDWLNQHGRSALVPNLDDRSHTELHAALLRLRAMPAPRRPEPAGNMFVTNAISDALRVPGARTGLVLSTPAGAAVD
jgi:hypothetical protein